MTRVVPSFMSFERALNSGMLGRIEDGKYTRWVKALPCCKCSAQADDPHHIYNVLPKGIGTKVPDYFTIPLCRICHDELHRDVRSWEEANGQQIHHVMMTLMRAIYEGVLDVTL